MRYAHIKPLLWAAVLALAALAGTVSHAQTPQQIGPPFFPQTLPSNTLVGRISAGTGPAQAVPFSSLQQLAIGNISVGVTPVLGGIANDLLTVTGSVLGQITAGNSCVYLTNSSGVPSCANTLTGGLELQPASNATGVKIDGYAITGANTQPIADWSGSVSSSAIVDIHSLNLSTISCGSVGDCNFVNYKNNGNGVFAIGANGEAAVYVANASSTGTSLNTLAKLTGAPSTAVIAATTDTAGVIGVVQSGNGTTGSAKIAIAGQALCVFDGATTAGHYVQISGSTAGNCHDTGAATYPASGQVIGRVLSTNGSGGTYTVQLFSAEIQAASVTAGTTMTSGITSGNLISSSSNLIADSGVAASNVATLSGSNTFTNATNSFNHSNTTVSIGASGTGGDSPTLLINGGSGSAGGGVVLFQFNGGGAEYIGPNSGISGSGTDHSLTMLAVGGGTGIRLAKGTFNSQTLMFDCEVSNAGQCTASVQLNGTTGSFSSHILNTGISTDSGQTATATVCEDTTTHQFYFGSGTGGICKGTSSARFKDNISAINEGLPQIMAMLPVQYYAKPGYGDPEKPLYGFLAEDMNRVSQVITEHDKDGLPSSVDYIAVIPVLVRAIQQQQAELEAIKARQ